MTDCPKPQCVQDSRITTTEVRLNRAERDARGLCKFVKEIHAEIVDKNGGGIKSRLVAIETTLRVRDRGAERFWKIFGIGVAALAVIVAIVE